MKSDKMKTTLRIAALSAALLFGASNMLAVTDKEMEEARVITAKLYLRYANNGSGYLDELPAQPKTMAELEKVLKTKETENLKAFKAVGTPKDYASWDKAKLVEYWGKTFFTSPGLTEKGKEAARTVQKRLGNMTVSAPTAAAEPAKSAETASETPTAAETSKPEAQTTAEQTPEMVLEEQVQALEEQTEAAVETEPVVEKKSNNTWIYIAILCVLVGVVIWLLVYAGNFMKSQNAASANQQKSNGKAEAALKAEIAKLRKENEELKRETDALIAEKKRLTRELREAERKPLTASSEPARPAAQEPEKSEMVSRLERAMSDAPTAPRQPQRPAKTIYLGRVNQKGIFVCANRNFTPGSSYYKLVTSDGISGSFSPVEDAETWEAALERPAELQNGCTGRNLDHTDGMTEIITEAPGTAVFEGGCWRVSRKARIALA